MLFSRINLRNELVRERDQKDALLEQANALLNSAVRKDDEVISRLRGSSIDGEEQEVQITDLGNIFSIEEIRKICIRYRLRFLDTAHFRSEYPYDAIAEIHSFERKYGVKIGSFRIIAPSGAFELENINKDPLLFAQLNDGTYYLLHQWGKDLVWYRKFLVWPLQNLKTLMIALIFICMAFSFSLPTSIFNVFNFQSEIYLRIWLTLHTFIGSLGLILWAGLSFDKSFSSMCWDSKYYNY